MTVSLVDRFLDSIKHMRAGVVFNVYNNESKEYCVNILVTGKGTKVALCEDVELIDTRMSDEDRVLAVLEQLSLLQLENEKANQVS